MADGWYVDDRVSEKYFDWSLRSWSFCPRRRRRRFGSLLTRSFCWRLIKSSIAHLSCVVMRLAGSTTPSSLPFYEPTILGTVPITDVTTASSSPLLLLVASLPLTAVNSMAADLSLFDRPWFFWLFSLATSLSTRKYNPTFVGVERETFIETTSPRKR